MAYDNDVKSLNKKRNLARAVSKEDLVIMFYTDDTRTPIINRYSSIPYIKYKILFPLRFDEGADVILVDYYESRNNPFVIRIEYNNWSIIKRIKF